MLYYLLYQCLQRYFSPLNVFRYITVRTVYASLTAMFLGVRVWAVADSQAARAADRAVHPRRRPAGAPEESGHADDGRRADRAFDVCANAACGPI